MPHAMISDECPHCDYSPRFVDTMCSRCGKNPRQVPPDDCIYTDDYTICEVCEDTNNCPLCDAVTGGKTWCDAATCCVCQEITLCNDCCPEVEKGGEHGSGCWSECIENGYPHRICVRCVYDMKRMTADIAADLVVAK